VEGEGTLAGQNPAQGRYDRLIADAVAGLEEDTVDARRDLYDRARKAFAARLVTCNPPLAKTEVQRESQAFEEAIIRVEAQADGQHRLRQPPPGKDSIHEGQVNLPATEMAALSGDRTSAQLPQQHELLSNPLSGALTAMEQLHEGEPDNDPALTPVAETATGEGPPLHSRLQAMLQAARYHGIELDVNEFRPAAGEAAPAPAALSQWAQNAGMWSRAVRIRWRHLLRFHDTGPVVLLFKDGSAGQLTGADAEQMVVFLKSPFAPAAAAAVAVDELRLAQAWDGEAVLLRANRGHVAADALFNFRWLVELVLQERRSLRDIGIASLTISILTVFPPILVMATVNKVMQFHSVSILVLISVMMAVVFAYETLLGYARRLVIAVIGARLDAKLNLHVFNRLLRLPLDYFERHPAGETCISSLRSIGYASS
jgi:hypothetical protein